MIQMLTPLQIEQLKEAVGQAVQQMTQPYTHMGRNIYEAYKRERDIGYVPPKYRNAYARQFGTPAKTFANPGAEELPDGFTNIMP